jgi:SAM-dependent methyltransferase
MSDAWRSPETVAGFVKSPPNETLLAYAASVLKGAPAGRALDIGCGAGRNAIPLMEQGWDVLGVDDSEPMLAAASTRVRGAEGGGFSGRVRLARAAMDALPATAAAFDLVVAHGIWNLARSAEEFRRALAEAARVSRRGAGLFVFTFSRNTLPVTAAPVEQPFVFTDFSGEPQCFLSREQLIEELNAAGFVLDPRVPLVEHNRPKPGALATASRVPVIYEAAFTRR